MKKIIYSLFVLFSLIAFESKSQVFWVENFGTGIPCNGAQVANVIATPTTGLWTITTMATAPGNGAEANEWFISGTEQGQLPGSCGGVGCEAFNNYCLHIG